MILKSLLLLQLCASQSLAQDLYELPADPSSSFVRIVAPGETLAVIDGITFDKMDGGVTPFLMVSPGPVSVTVGTHEGVGEIAAASFYTFTPAEDGTVVMLQDKITNSPAKADLVFYNLSDLPSVDLFAPAVAATILSGVVRETSRQVSLKAPLTLDLQVQAEGTMLVELAGVTMERQAGVTVVFSGHAGAYSAQSIPNSYAN